MKEGVVFHRTPQPIHLNFVKSLMKGFGNCNMLFYMFLNYHGSQFITSSHQRPDNRAVKKAVLTIDRKAAITEREIKILITELSEVLSNIQQHSKA